MSLLANLNDIERPFKLIERSFRHPEERQLVPYDFFRQWDFFKPLDELNTALKRLGIGSERSRITADDEKFQVRVDVQHFAPEEVRVKVLNGQVIVEGKHEEKRDEHGYISRYFVRKYALPEGCLPDTVTSSLSSDGVLTVTAPRVLVLPSTGEKIIPIKHTGPVKKYY